MRNKGYEKLGGGGGANLVHYGKCGSGVLRLDNYSQLQFEWN